MKKYLSFVFFLALLGTFSITSCSDDDDDDEIEATTLTLSTDSLVFGKEASTSEVTVLTNQDNWSAVPSVDWIEIIKSDDFLSVTVSENTGYVGRKGVIVIIAGTYSETIVITQGESPSSVYLSPEELEIDQWGGERTFYVETDDSDWTVGTDADWLTVASLKQKNEVVINIDENTDRKSREAIIAVSTKTDLAHFVVRQSGTMYFILPYLVHESSAGDIAAFEQKRRSFNVRMPDNVNNLKYWDYETLSPLFELIRYTVDVQGQTEAVAFVRPENEDDLAKIFDDEMTAAGFTESENVYLKKTKDFTITAKADTDEDSGRTFVAYTLMPVQHKPYPTFDKFPYGYTNFYSARFAEIDEWEKLNGGKYDEASSTKSPLPLVQDMYVYEVKTGTYAPELRIYFMQNDGLKKVLAQTGQYFTENAELCFWEKKGGVYMTDEFAALLEKEGFVYRNTADSDDRYPFVVYENKEKGFLAGIRPVQIYENSDKWAAQINILASGDYVPSNSYVNPAYKLKMDFPQRGEREKFVFGSGFLGF